MIAKGVESLSETDRLILYLRFARDLTQSEIAQRVGTSQMQVSRLLRSAIEKIRRASGELDPRPEWGSGLAAVHGALQLGLGHRGAPVDVHPPRLVVKLIRVRPFSRLVPERWPPRWPEDLSCTEVRER